jgi:hypothetical protein
MWPFTKAVGTDNVTSTRDINAALIPDTAWNNEEQAAASLDKLYQHVVTQTEKVANWYIKAKRPKARYARDLRILAIVATAGSGAVPILSQLYTDQAGAPQVKPAYASLLLAVAGLCVAIDHYFGLSTAWMRYVSTQQDVKKANDDFQFDWQIERSKWEAGKPTSAQAQNALVLLKAFATQVNLIVQKETNAWISEFSSAIKVIDDTVSQRAEEGKPGGTNVTVTNGDTFAGGWNLQVDGGAAHHYVGKSAGLPNLPSGMRRITVTAVADDGSPKQAETTVSLTPGKIENVSLTL